MSRILEPQHIAASSSTPPLFSLPPAGLFSHRAARLHSLAAGHALGEYLNLAGDLCQVQQSLLDHPPAAPTPAPERLQMCHQHGLPPLVFDSLVREGAWQPWLDALLLRYSPPAQPAVQQALLQLEGASTDQRKVWALGLLSGQYSAVPAAVAPFLGAALQAAWTHWLLDMPGMALTPGPHLNQCPACGSPAMAGVIRHRGAYNGLRYLVCSLCACEWHAVRVKCIYCEKSQGLQYTSLATDRHAPGTAPLRAETCPHCGSYLKLLYLEHDADAEALSADLASLPLDLRLDEEGYQRQAPNLLLSPGGP